MNKSMLLLPCAAVLFCGCGKDDAQQVSTLADNPVSVVTQVAAQDVFSRVVQVQGSLEAVESATVSARIPGPLVSVDVDLGDKVEKGRTVLFKVDSEAIENKVAIAREDVATAEAQVTVSEAQLAKAKAVAKKAASDAERFRRLKDGGRVSDNEFEQADTARETSEADVALAEASLVLARQKVSQARANLAIAERSLSDATVLSPIDGVVDKRNCEPGEMVAAGTPVVVVTGPSQLKALAFLPAAYYGDVVEGETPVRVSVRGSEPFDAKVVAKSAAVNPNLRTFEIKALVPGGGKAVAGEMADMAVSFDEHKGVSVPTTAVLNRAAGSVVFVADGDKAREVPVVVGLVTDGRTEIVSGLDEGAAVVVKGQTQLYDGCRIGVVQDK